MHEVYMKQELLRHPHAYAALIFGLVGWGLLFMAVWPHVWWQRLVILGACSFYFVWGIVIHHKWEMISKNIMYEYAGVSALAGVLLLLITL